ncbi:hypothetical protein FB45DRAFT_1067583 [Roridomyces roridus]|uniref:F-box domain-containing protein n=1 Tax=Roridomyces roridus TaxID=1738132 RepID=A0AAD7B1V5_9AGAR|nr:hypothetical protein FB45DRAFT_1067583 [Roridomyces roridus]
MSAASPPASPVLSLPPEITAEIFVFSLPASPELRGLAGLSSPSLFLQLCRLWRDIALGTPALWSSINVDLEKSNDARRKRQLREYAPFVEAIVLHVSRWQHLDIGVPRASFPDITAPMPLLLSAAVDWRDDPDTSQQTTSVAPPVPIFQSAPNLRTVSLDFEYNPYTRPLPWSQITTLTAQCYPVDAIHILDQTTALETCALIVYSDGYPVPAGHRVPPLTQLRSFSLEWGEGCPDPDGRPQLFDALTLPVLDSLVVTEYFLGPDPIAALARVRPRGYPRKMHILDAWMSPEVYEQAFPDVEVKVRVESLKIYYSGGGVG